MYRAILGIDPGYATAGVALIVDNEFRSMGSFISKPQKRKVVDREKVYKMSEFIQDEDVVFRCERLSDRICRSFNDRGLNADEILVVTEEWKATGPNNRSKPRTTYYRGMFDAMLRAKFRLMGVAVLTVPAMWVRQFSNAGGKAVQNSKAPSVLDILTYVSVSMMAQLDVRYWHSEGASVIEPVEGKTRRRTEGHSLHYADAAVMAAMTHLAINDGKIAGRPASQRAIIGRIKERLDEVRQRRSDEDSYWATKAL